MPLHPVSRDVFVRRSDPTGKHAPVITQHRAWDVGLFVASQVKQYDTDAKPDERRIVSIATAAEYRAANHKKGR